MLKYWLWLTALPLLGYKKLPRLLDKFGTPENIFFAASGDYADLELSSDDLKALAHKNLDRAELVAEQCSRLKIQIVTLGDSAYPPQLAAIDDAPCVLYVKGDLSAPAIAPAIAIVGTRAPSPYGLKTAREFSFALAKSGLIIVSGMAKGIDAAAHTAALRADRPTVAVLGCGADVIYPQVNDKLYYDIIERGCLLTEFPPGTPPEGQNFPRRNRIISGLSLGALIVEAKVRSGALITARTAVDQGRDLFVIPGPIDAPNSGGCNLLIKEFSAIATSPRDIIEEYEARHELAARRETITPEIPEYEARKPKKTPPPPDLSPLAAQIYKHLPATADRLAAITNTPVSEILAELTVMEIDGAVTKQDGGIYNGLSDR